MRLTIGRRQTPGTRRADAQADASVSSTSLLLRHGAHPLLAPSPRSPTICRPDVMTVRITRPPSVRELRSCPSPRRPHDHLLA
jgi:hypothetical protein